MDRLLRAPEENIRRCEYPGCTEIIGLKRRPDEPSLTAYSLKKNDRSRGYKIRKDKKFCNDKHRYRYYNEYVRPKKGGAQGSDQ